jgi:hypothetical protein
MQVMQNLELQLLQVIHAETTGFHPVRNTFLRSCVKNYFFECLSSILEQADRIGPAARPLKDRQIVSFLVFFLCNVCTFMDLHI